MPDRELMESFVQSSSEDDDLVMHVSEIRHYYFETTSFDEDKETGDQISQLCKESQIHELVPIQDEMKEKIEVQILFGIRNIFLFFVILYFFLFFITGYFVYPS